MPQIARRILPRKPNILSSDWVTDFRRPFLRRRCLMNARKVFLLILAISLVGPSFGQAGEALGTAKARGDFRPYSQAQQSATRSVRRSQPAYRYSAPRSAPVIVESPVIREVPGPIVAQAPVAEARRFSQAPAAEKDATATSNQPCPQTSATAAPSSSGRRYSYAPAPASSGNYSRSFSGNSGRSSAPTWSLPKTDPRKFNSR